MKGVILNFVVLLIGIVIGLILAVKAFDIKVDILGIPYRNQPVVVTKDIILIEKQFLDLQ